jgi:UDP-galactopyranose mutase
MMVNVRLVATTSLFASAVIRERHGAFDWCDLAEGEIHRLKLRHQHDDVRAFYDRFTGDVIMSLEASGYSAWFEQLLADWAIRSGWAILQKLDAKPRAARRTTAAMLI